MKIPVTGETSGKHKYRTLIKRFGVKETRRRFKRVGTTKFGKISWWVEKLPLGGTLVLTVVATTESQDILYHSFRGEAIINYPMWQTANIDKAIEVFEDILINSYGFPEEGLAKTKAAWEELNFKVDSLEVLKFRIREKNDKNLVKEMQRRL